MINGYEKDNLDNLPRSKQKKDRGRIALAKYRLKGATALTFSEMDAALTTLNYQAKKIHTTRKILGEQLLKMQKSKSRLWRNEK